MAASTTVKKKYTCSRCKKTMAETKFYTYKDGSKVELCKDCLCAHINNFDPDTFTWILKKMDVPYIPWEWNTLRDRKYQEDPVKGTGGPAVMGKYLAKMKLKQWYDKETGKPYTWDDTDRLIEELGPQQQEPEMTEEDKEAEEAHKKEIQDMYEKGEISEAEYKTLTSTEDQIAAGTAFPDALPNGNVADPFDFDSQYMSEDELPDPAAELTDEDKIYLAMKWGRLYKPNEWVSLEQKYVEMENSFDIQDADSRNTLILLCKTDLKMNQALDCGDIDGYQKLSRVSDSLRKSAKFTAAQNKDKDNEQIDCTGVLVAVCEREGGFIPPDLCNVKQDMIDVSIKDTQKYLYNLVTKDLGFGQQIENYLKKIQLEHDAMKASETDEVDEITDENIAEYYERIEEEKEKDSTITEESNAYNRKEDS
ncbi:MAG: hypothetical protein J6T10_18785 [Methanobrevibacter sp.]|nr:hypothetical protein [Methanobrevibacter sp.]